MKRIAIVVLLIVLAGCSGAGQPGDTPTPQERTVIVEPTPVERTVVVTKTVPSPTPEIRTVVGDGPTPEPVNGVVDYSVQLSRDEVAGDWRVWYVDLTVENDLAEPLTAVELRVTALDENGTALDSDSQTFSDVDAKSTETFDRYQALDIRPEDVGSEVSFVVDLSYEVGDVN